MTQLRCIFVVGSQRSGTTLVGQMAGSHPETLLLDEGDGVYDWFDAACNEPGSRRDRRLLHRACRRARGKYVEPDKKAGLLGRPSPRIGSLVLKAPNLTQRHVDIAGRFPNSRVLYLARDPRDVVASMMKLTRVPILENQLTLLGQAPHIHRDFPAELAAASDANAGKARRLANIAKIKMSLAPYLEAEGLAVLRVQYEELVAQPEASWAAIAHHLGLEPSPLPLEHHRVLIHRGPGGTNRERRIDGRSIGSWRRVLSSEEAEEVLEVAGDLLPTKGVL